MKAAKLASAPPLTKGKRRLLVSEEQSLADLQKGTPSYKRKEKVAGAPSHCPPDSVPQTPSGELRPLHPLFMCGCQNCSLLTTNAIVQYTALTRYYHRVSCNVK